MPLEAHLVSGSNMDLNIDSYFGSNTGHGRAFKIQDSRFKIQDSRFKIQDPTFITIQDSRFKIPDSRFQIQGSPLLMDSLSVVCDPPRRTAYTSFVPYFGN